MSVVSNQRGVSIIAVVATMLILSVMGVTLISLVTTGSDISINQMQSHQALNVAEAGREYVVENGTFPNYYTPTVLALGSGSFSVETPTWVFLNITGAEATINVDSTADFSASGRIVIDSELINYAGVTPTSFTGATRGVAGTAVDAHATNNSVYPVTDLTVDPGAASTTITVSSTTGFVIPGVVKLESEYLYCNGTVTTPARFTGCQRGYDGTTASAHAVGSNVFQYVIVSTGTVGNAQRVVRMAVDGGSGVVELINDGSFLNSTTFSSFNNWSTADYSKSEGSSLWNVSSHTSGSGSMLTVTTSGKKDWLKGYREQMFSSIISGGTTLTMKIWYKKDYVLQPDNHVMEVQLVYTAGGPATPAGWSDSAASNTNVWTNISSTFTIPAAKNVEGIRLYFDIKNQNSLNSSASIWFDEISLTTTTNSNNMLDFREIY